VSTAYALKEHEELELFAPVIVRKVRAERQEIYYREGLLSLMMAEHPDHYGDHIKDFGRFVSERGGVVTLDLVHDYFRDLKVSTLAANTIRIRRQAVKARLRVEMDKQGDLNEAAKYREALSRLDRGETAAPKIQAAPIGADKVIRRDEYDRLLAVATRRDGLLLRYLWTTGCRASELTGARLDRCEVKGKVTQVVIRGKGDKERTLRIPTTLFEEIRTEFHGQTFLFETGGGRPFSRVYLSTRVHELVFKVLGRKLGAHALRHSFATRQIRRTGKIQAVSTYLGHSSVSITLGFYCHEVLDDGELFDPEDGE